MSTPKCPVKARKLAKKRQRKQKAKQRRQRRGEQGVWESSEWPTQFEGFAPPLRMSVVMEDFVEPYMNGVATTEQFRRLMGWAAIAWNIALSDDPANRRDEIRRSVNDLRRFEASTLDAASCTRLIEEMVARKRRHFAHILRPILAYDVSDDGDQWSLQVASAIV